MVWGNAAPSLFLEILVENAHRYNINADWRPSGNSAFILQFDIIPAILVQFFMFWLSLLANQDTNIKLTNSCEN